MLAVLAASSRHNKKLILRMTVLTTVNKCICEVTDLIFLRMYTPNVCTEVCDYLLLPRHDVCHVHLRSLMSALSV